MAQGRLRQHCDTAFAISTESKGVIYEQSTNRTEEL